jgi:hypothetical protein
MSTSRPILNTQQIRVSRLFELLHGIDLSSGIAGSFGFSYALGRNKKIIMDQCKDIESMNKAEPGYEAYQRERVELIENLLAKKIGDQIEFTEAPDGSGKIPVFKNPEAAEISLANLALKYSSEIEARKSKNREYIRFYNEETVEVQLYTIKKEHLPEDELTPAMVYGILELIEETE